MGSKKKYLKNNIYPILKNTRRYLYFAKEKESVYHTGLLRFFSSIWIAR